MYYRIKYDLIGDLDVKTVMQNELFFSVKMKNLRVGWDTLGKL